MNDIKAVLKRALVDGASDVHVVIDKRPIYRINRNLIEDPEMEPVSTTELDEWFDFFTLGSEDLKKSFSIDKRLDINFNFEDTRLRVNIAKASGDYTFVARIIKNELPSFEELGLPEVVRRLALLPQGLILVTGKSNSGKTTTLNTLVNEINKTENKKVMMLENPIEYVHRSQISLIVQKEVGKGKDCETFEEGVVNALREDCDVLVIGEIRDKDTMEAAIEMAEAGHLVIGTMHTKSASETIDRALNFFEISDQLQIKYMLSSVLKAVITQRLLPGKRKSLVMVPEIMIVDDTISGLIRKDKFSRSEIEDAIQTRAERGNISFINSLANAILKNQITIEQAKKQLDDKSKENLARLLNQLR